MVPENKENGMVARRKKGIFKNMESRLKEISALLLGVIAFFLISLHGEFKELTKEVKAISEQVVYQKAALEHLKESLNGWKLKNKK